MMVLLRTFAALAPSPTSDLFSVQESAFLVTSVLVLELGMVFSSRGFPPGTVGYVLLNIITAAIILGSAASFIILLAFEVYRSIKLAVAYEQARKVEMAMEEERLLQKSRSGRRRKQALKSAQLFGDTSGTQGLPGECQCLPW